MDHLVILWLHGHSDEARPGCALQLQWGQGNTFQLSILVAQHPGGTAYCRCAVERDWIQYINSK
jgi:hypothetical protein